MSTNKRRDVPTFGERRSPSNVNDWLELNDFNVENSVDNNKTCNGIRPQNSIIHIRTEYLQRQNSFKSISQSSGSSVRMMAGKFNCVQNDFNAALEPASELSALKDIVKNRVESFKKDFDSHKYINDKYYNRREFPEKNCVKTLKRNFEKTESVKKFELIEKMSIVDNFKNIDSDVYKSMISSFSLEGEFV